MLKQFCYLTVLLSTFLVIVQSRSIGESAGVSSSNQANYQEYSEQQEYVEQQGEVERQVREAPQANDEANYQPGPYMRDETECREQQSNADSGYQANMGAEEVAVQNGRLAEERRLSARQQDSKSASEIDPSQREEMSLRRSENVENGDQRESYNYRQARDNPSKPNEEAPQKNDASVDSNEKMGYDMDKESAINESPKERFSRRSEGSYNMNNFNYIQEPETNEVAEGLENGPIANEETGVPAQYDQASNLS